MASAGKNRTKREKVTQKKPKTGLIILGVMGVVLAGVLVAGMSSVFRVTKTAPDDASAAVGALAIADRETTFLGAPTDAAALASAEAGQFGVPTLVFFHADW